MKRNFIGKQELKSYGLELSYYILEGDSEYGIEIEKKESKRIEKSIIKDITTDLAYVEYIVNVLMRNTVTPVHLYDIIYDLL